MGAPRTKSLIVFPARAGMSPRVRYERELALCFPRTRGDEPPHIGAVRIANGFSPHARG